MHRRYLGLAVVAGLLTVGFAPSAIATTTSAVPSAKTKCTITGTSGNDVLRGTSDRDVICGLGGDDRILGLEGHDVLNGGPGDDTLVGGPGNDILIGGLGDDILLGGTGSDTTLGGAGSDQVAAGTGKPKPDEPTPAPFAVPKTCAQLHDVQPTGVAASTTAAAAAVAAGFQLPTVGPVLFAALVKPPSTLEQKISGVVCEVAVAAAAPTSVSELKATATSSVTARLEWKAPTPAVTGVAYQVSGSGNIEITGTAAEISGLSPQTKYDFSVTAANSAGTSAPVSVSLTTHAAPPPPTGGGDSLLTTTYNKSTGITARMQWNSNSGYCGETSFITALLRNGGYTSQWTARSIAADGHPQTDPNSQLMIGSNGWGVTDHEVATSMGLAATEYPNSSETDTDQFLAWVKQYVIADATVIIGVYNNVNMLGEGGTGDPSYDHIVPVVGVGSNQPLADSSTYYRDDIITISDNGLYTPSGTFPPSNSPENPSASALYTFDVDDWQNYRAGANSGSSIRDLYSAAIYVPPPPSSDVVLNWGIAITGIIDESTVPQTIPVQLTSSLDGEGLQNGNTMSAPPAPSELRLTATARPASGTAYNVYIYEDFDDVPTRDFNTNARNESRDPDYTIPNTNGGTWTQTIVTDTAQTRIFRIVPTTAT